MKAPGEEAGKVALGSTEPMAVPILEQQRAAAP